MLNICIKNYFYADKLQKTFYASLTSRVQAMLHSHLDIDLHYDTSSTFIPIGHLSFAATTQALRTNIFVMDKWR